MTNKIRFTLQAIYCLGILAAMTWFAGCRSTGIAYDSDAVVEAVRVLVESDSPPEARLVALRALRDEALLEVTRDWIDDEIAAVEAEMREPEPTPEPTAQPTPEPDPTFLSEIVWLKRDVIGADAQVTKQLTGLTIDRRGIRFDPLQVADWPAGPLGGDLKGVMCIVAMRDGRWSGGKYEHIRHGMRDRHHDNIRNGYIENFRPRSGEAVRFFILSYDGKQASNYVEVRWP